MTTKQKKPSEHAEQVALFAWAAMASSHFPELDLLFAVPNAGKRSMGAAQYYKSEGLRPGIPDVWLPVARGWHHGLVIEMKRKPNKPSDTQQWWMDRLAEQGYMTAVCWSFNEARDTILRYLEGDK